MRSPSRSGKHVRLRGGHATQSTRGRLTLHITDQQTALKLPRALLRKAVRHVLSAEGRLPAEISLAFVDDATIARVHGERFGDPSPTDVITVPLTEPGESPLEGEIIVSGDHASAEAARRGHSPAHEALLYVVHGLLHLCGHDDRTPSAFHRMHAREDELLTELGVGPVFMSRLLSLRKSRRAR
jgi:probable rRNA maturation factor